MDFGCEADDPPRDALVESLTDSGLERPPRSRSAEVGTTMPISGGTMFYIHNCGQKPSESQHELILRHLEQYELTSDMIPTEDDVQS